ncbi:hypothetical protein LLE49_18230 [Alicyclobacillus tolerans]|uniref:hypothetical protein n=1 Tax=Alicyclobacillus tolerans TaxID=90970 RepID=UPI001F2BC8F0|nr:hypothetical protein [Alicyclobacillus tolerans]MCF8566666.1 hypothetical protein [Alicyclobacillus tolerans]
MDISYPFEQLTLSSPKDIANIRYLKKQLERSEIKVVDIKRHRDQLVVTYRRLHNSSGLSQ